MAYNFQDPNFVSSFNANPIVQDYLVSSPTANNPYAMSQDPTATAKPYATSWTSSNGLTTTGIMNPFGLTQNNPSMGYMGASSPSTPAASPESTPAPFPEPTINPLTNAPYNQPDYAPYGFGNTDPVGDARRAASMSGTGDPGYDPTTAPYTNPAGTTPGVTPASPTAAQPYTNPSSAANGFANNNPTNTLGSAANFAPSWLNGVTITSPDNTGGTITQNANSRQWAAPDTANTIANQFGGKSFGQQINMPGGNYSSPMQMIGFNNGNQINAGLAADALGKYGNGPSSYGTYLVQRDATGNIGSKDPGYDQWAMANGGTPNSGPGYNFVPDRNGTYTNLVTGQQGLSKQQITSIAQGALQQQTQQQQQAQQQQQMQQPQQQQPNMQPRNFGVGDTLLNAPQNQQNQQYGNQQQQQQQLGNFFQQLGPIMQLLQMLGIFGGGGQGIGMNAMRQRPPQLPSNSSGFPYFSPFA